MLFDTNWNESDYDMKSGGAAGAVAGVVGGIFGVVFGAIGYWIGLYGPAPIPEMEWMAYWVVLTIIFGAIFGVIYAKMYDSIPGEGLLKGVSAGLIIWLIRDISAGAYLAAERHFEIAIPMIWIGFFMWIGYGPVLGKLYKK